MRQPFNTTVDIWEGPRGDNPNALRGTCDCRFVLQTGIFSAGLGTPIRHAWVTMDALMPRGGWTNPAMGFAPSVADQLAIPSGSARQWWVIYTEFVFWGGEPFYWRANVAELPLPGGGVLPPLLGVPLIFLGVNGSGPGSPAARPTLLFGSVNGTDESIQSGPSILFG